MHRDTVGLYAVWKPDTPPPADLARHPHLAGLTGRFSWARLEPAEGAPDWSLTDALFEAAAAAGKRVHLAVAAGDRSPGWLHAGVGTPALPGGPAVPLPWCPRYQEALAAFARRLGVRYGRRRELASVTAAGVGHGTAELRLPWQGPGWRDAWYAAGYTPARAADAWQAHAGAWARAFPGKGLAVRLAARGLPRRRGEPDPEGLVVGRLCGTYPHRAVVMSCALSAFWDDPLVRAVAADYCTGQQHLWFVTGNDGGEFPYRANGGVPAPEGEVFRAVLARGLDAGARFQEVYAADVRNPALQGHLAWAAGGGGA
jgi:hypothetical protein